VRDAARRRFEVVMIVEVLRRAALALALLPAAAAAEPITLKLAYFSSDRTHLYLSGAKPFVDAVNNEGRGRVKIEPFFSGRLGNLAQQSQMVRDGTADIGYVIPPYERAAFPDAAVMELPGLYKDGTEATRVFSQLIAAGLFRGLDDFFVIGAFTSEPESIHTRPPVASLADLKGKRIRANNEIEIEILKKLDASPQLIPINQTAQAISSGQIDGALVPPAPMIEFGIGRVAPNHYFLRTSCVPQMLLMNRRKLESLPADVQTIIRKYSGVWHMDGYFRINDAATGLVMSQIETDPRRKFVLSSPTDMQTADAIFKSIVDGYAAASPHNAALGAAARAAVAKLRAAP
jgi:TRAP-type C4-dicarboxylate transport system substrate-binding protein